MLLAELARQKRSEVAPPDTDRLPSFPPFPIPKRVVNLRGIALNVMFIITICIHTDGKQDDKIHEDCGKLSQGLELEPEVEWVHETKAQYLVRG